MRIKLITRNKDIIFDLIFNTIAYALPISITQLIVLPVLGRYMQGDSYGMVLTIISLLNLLPHTIGNTLNNTRLIHNQRYIEENESGDFRFLLRISCIVNTIFMFGGVLYYSRGTGFQDNIFIILLAILWLLREYYIVEFRLRLDFKSILFNNTFMAIGYILGLFVFFLTKRWYSIYIFGQLFSLLLVFKKTGIYREPKRRTGLFKKTAKDYIVLLASNFVDNSLNNIDKLFIYPILGGTAVAVYFASTVYTKIISLCVTPVSGVLLSYLSGSNKKSNGLFLKVLCLSLSIAVLGYVVCILIGKTILTLLYPQYMNEALKYIYITSATSMLLLVRSLIRPFLLKYCKTEWQLIIGVLGTITYLIVAFTFVHTHEIWAVCIGVLAGTIVKLGLMILVYLKKSYRIKEG